MDTYINQGFCTPLVTHRNEEKVFAIMEERSQSSNGERSQSCDRKISDDGYVEEKSFDCGEHRSCGHNSMNDALTNEAKETLTQDRISAVPDSILLHILSFLPTKDAIKTSMFSQRWLYLWTSVPNLHFTCTFWGLDFKSKFITFVNETLLSHKHCDIDRFIVKFRYDDSYNSNIDTWVHFATSANVEELCIGFSGGYEFEEYHYVLPQHIYTNSSMMALKLMWCNVAPNGLISWKSLKSLFIGYTNLSEDVIQKILVGAPVLESLELYGCWGLNMLDIGSESLRELVVRDYPDFRSTKDDPVLEISAPNLQSLGIAGKMCRKKFRLMNLQSLDDCDLKFELTTYDEDYANDFEEQRNMVGELLDRLRHVKKLTLGNWCIQVLSILELEGMLSPVFKCKCLILNTYIKKCDVPGIVGLLQSSLNLETLVVNMTSLYGLTSLYESECEVDENIPENYWTSECESSKCSLLHLKTVKIIGFVAQHLEFGLVLPLVQFLLEKGRTLEKIVINAKRGKRMECFGMESLQVAQKLLNLPRISPHAVVVLSE